MGAENPFVLTCQLNVWEANKNELYGCNFDILFSNKRSYVLSIFWEW